MFGLFVSLFLYDMEFWYKVAIRGWNF